MDDAEKLAVVEKLVEVVQHFVAAAAVDSLVAVVVASVADQLVVVEFAVD